MDTAYIAEAEAHLMAVIQEEIALNGSFKRHADFAKAAFGDEVANFNGKWSRLRSGKNHLTYTDIVRISAALNTEPYLLLMQTYNNMRKAKLISN